MFINICYYRLWKMSHDDRVLAYFEQDVKEMPWITNVLCHAA